MAKDVYKVPASIDMSYADMEINLQTKDGIGGKPIPVGLILAYLASTLICFWFIMNGPLAKFRAGPKIIFSILWALMTALLLKRSDTGVPQYSMITSFLNYIPWAKRNVTTRSVASPKGFYEIVGIESIDLDRGLIKFADGQYGYMYQVVGSASVLLFDDDRRLILNRVDNFWRKIKTDAEWLFITVKEPQKVYKQVANLKKLHENLDTDDPDLKAMANTQFKMLTSVVGETYRSIHQYLILRADNLESLTVAKNILQGEIENSQLMFKQVIALFGDDLLHVLATIYQGEESV